MDTINLLQNLIRIPSISREEEAACDYLQKWLTDNGFQDVRRIGNNLWMESEAPCDKPTLLLNAHIDTVKPNHGYTRDPFSPEVIDGRLYGLGSNDDGGSLVALLEAYSILSSKPQPYRLVYAATSEEEVCGKGGFDLFARNEGVNAIYEALKDIEWFRTYQFPKVSEYLGPVKMSVTMIAAGTQHNVVPDECRFVVDVRPNGMYSNLELLGLIKEAVKCEVKERSTRIGSSHLPTSHPVVVRGLSLGLQPFGSPTTSNQALCPFPTLKIGPGDSARSHGPDEYIRLDEISSAVGVYVKLLDQLEI